MALLYVTFPGLSSLSARRPARDPVKPCTIRGAINPRRSRLALINVTGGWGRGAGRVSRAAEYGAPMVFQGTEGPHEKTEDYQA